MTSKILKAALAGLVLMLSNYVYAGLIYDADVTPDVIFGSGNANGYFVVDRQNDIEVGLRAKVPYTNTFNSDGAGTYSMSSGDHPKWGAPGAAWNFEFSINVNLDGQNDEKLTDFFITLSVDTDPSADTDWFSLLPVFAFPDNAIGNNYSLAQNSMNIGWLGQSIDTSIAALYDFKLSVMSFSTQEILAETFMTVEVDGGVVSVPEPSTLAIFGLGIIGLGMRRFKKKS